MREKVFEAEQLEVLRLEKKAAESERLQLKLQRKRRRKTTRER